MLLKLCIIAGAVAAGGIVLADWLNPASGAGGAPVDEARGIADAVYEPVARAAGQAVDSISEWASGVKDAVLGFDPTGALSRIFG